jgi:hypothetical protein
VHTDLTLSGAVAQYGRGVGMIQATAAQLMKQFAQNLKAQPGMTAPAAAPASTASVAAPAPAAPSAPPAAAKPISGFALMGRVIWDAIMGLFGRRPS